MKTPTLFSLIASLIALAASHAHADSHECRASILKAQGLVAKASEDPAGVLMITGQEEYDSMEVAVKGCVAGLDATQLKIYSRLNTQCDPLKNGDSFYSVAYALHCKLAAVDFATHFSSK
jgi:hypothetical protein